MKLEEYLYKHLTSFHTAPFLFIGSGISRRYLGLEDWQDLLRRFSEMTDRPYEYYRASGGGNEPAIASEIARELHSIWWRAKEFKESRLHYKTETLNRESALKIEIARYLEQKSSIVELDEDLNEELRLLPMITVDGIITTNWDLFLEKMFPDFRVYIGQEELLFSATQNIGELYKIHGCCSRPNSLVATSSDYEQFNRRNPYLAAKLLTVFAEHPIVFMGYAINDPNISEILQSIASCLTTKNIDQLRDRLVLIQWDTQENEYKIQDSNIVTGGYNIPVKTIATSSFKPVYSALSRLPRKFPAKLLRRLRQHVYELVKDNDPAGQLFVKDIDDDSNVADLQIVFGVGLYNESEKSESEQMEVIITNDPGATAVRLTNDADATELPFSSPEPKEKYQSAQEALVGAVRTWKTNDRAYVPAAQIWYFYAHRTKLDIDIDTAKCLLISSMHHNCPIHYWGSLLSREQLYQLLKEEIKLDLFPRIRYAARLAFALGCSGGEDILNRIEKTSKYVAARDLAFRLKKSLVQGGDVFTEYRSPVIINIRFEERNIRLDTSKIFHNKSNTEAFISKLAMSGDKRKRPIVKQFDALLYGSFK